MKFFHGGDILMKMLFFFSSKNARGNSPALRVIRAETRLTVYRSLPYQNKRKTKEQAAPHADTLDHHKHVFECDCSEKCACEFNNKFELYIEASYKGS